MKSLSLPIAAALLSLALPAGFARANDRIQELTYAPHAVYEISGAFRTATQIIFSPEETIRHAAIGDSIIDLGEGRYAIDDELEIVVLEGEGLVREQAGRRELLIPIRLRQAGGDEGRWAGNVLVEVIW